MRCDPLLLDHPTQQSRGTVGRVADQPVRLEIKTVLYPFDHGLGGRDLVTAVGGTGLDIHDDPVIGVDEVVDGVRVESAAAGEGRETRCRIGQGDPPNRLCGAHDRHPSRHRLRGADGG